MCVSKPPSILKVYELEATPPVIVNIGESPMQRVILAVSLPFTLKSPLGASFTTIVTGTVVALHVLPFRFEISTLLNSAV